MFIPKEYKDRIKLFFRRIIHNLPAISHRQVVAEQYCMSCETLSLVYSKDVASGTDPEVNHTESDESFCS
jgi:hypothetical protein